MATITEKKHGYVRDFPAFIIVCFAFVNTIYFYTPEVKLGTYYGIVSVRPSVCLSVRSVSHIMSAQYLEKCLSGSHDTW